jgi:ABC-2 type transport system permease protein
VKSVGPAAPPDASADAVAERSRLGALVAYFRVAGAMAEVEFHRVRREPLALLTRAAQPLLWLLVFGAGLSRVEELRPLRYSYQAFIVPGVIAQSVLFVAIFSGIAVIWERDLGVAQRVVVAPVARSAIILGKCLGAGVRALAQVSLVLAVVAVARIELRWTVASVIGALAVSLLGAMLFSSISMVIAAAVRSREQFMGLGQLIILPLFFASNALYPVRVMPPWLQAVAWVNPLTYEVEALRRLLLGAGPDRVLQDVAILIAGLVLAVAIAARTYPRRVV